ncbi:Cell differentiation family, Rcd1-like containing protein [Histomonas meleagridis]|uniref:Cell differentiation family, Rcd1-like containing protein n=1 Tax=Histomonas meleagridis TaxID=135588 RepID=UPI00355AB888|nr:Cell differentiation family, Rcd1-like containing protein [Histomonas meleagridis]KAH0801078.1 Cell differentiation family, Rcd1-like containing protein [Histomonas meleagridis]
MSLSDKKNVNSYVKSGTMSYPKIASNIKRPQSTPVVQQAQQQAFSQDQIVSEIKQINSENTRSQAVKSLLAKRANIKDLALMIWFSPGTVVSLLSDILNFYPNLASGETNVPNANNVYNNILLFQLVASNSDTKLPFVLSGIPTYLFPFFKLNSNNADAERFIGATIGVFAGLVKGKQSEIISSLIKSEFLPICLNTLAQWNGVIRIAAAYILKCLISIDEGYSIIANNQQQTKIVLEILNNALMDLNEDYDIHLSKSIIEVYTKLIGNASVSKILGSVVSKEFLEFRPKQNLDQQYRNFIDRVQSLSKTK